jgi:DNA polymerase-3 subunit alpha
VVDCRTVKNGFLGFENSYAYKDTVKLVKYRNGIDLDPDAFPIDD